MTEHRRARLPKWGGRHGARVKGSIKWCKAHGGYDVVYSHLLGYETTARATETYQRWSLAMNQYREHDRSVRERQRLEQFRSARLAPVTYS